MPGEYIQGAVLCPPKTDWDREQQIKSLILQAVPLAVLCQPGTSTFSAQLQAIRKATGLANDAIINARCELQRVNLIQPTAKVGREDRIGSPC